VQRLAKRPGEASVPALCPHRRGQNWVKEMALDHYVSQVHLKNFYAPTLGEKMYGIRKRDLREFSCSAKDVCRIADNSTNAYLVHDRAIEDFLRTIEPKYNHSVTKLRDGRIDADSIYVIVGFIGYVATCSPAGMRIHSEPLRRSVEATAAVLDAEGKLSTPPASLGGASFTELVESAALNIDIDPKYPQAMGIAGILEFVSRLGNASWEILINDAPGSSPYFTSDFPVVVEATRDPRVINRIVPLTPSLALRIVPDLNAARRKVDMSFPLFRSVTRRPSESEIRAINVGIVRCAEQLVFYQHHYEWVPRLVARNSRYRVEGRTQRISTENGQLLIAQQLVVPA
jgi:Protein of unknown function (DUF4238)